MGDTATPGHVLMEVPTLKTKYAIPLEAPGPWRKSTR